MKDQRLYAPPSEVSQEDSDSNKSFLSGDFETSQLIIEELPDAMSFYYEKSDVLATWFGEVPLYPNFS